MSAAALFQSARDAGVELRLVDGKVKITGKKSAVAGLIEPLRQHREDLVRWLENAAIPVAVLHEEYRLYSRLTPPPEPQQEPEPSTDPAAWRELAQAYHLHHFACKTCCAGGQGRGLRCGTGAALWRAYSDTSTQPAITGPHDECK